MVGENLCMQPGSWNGLGNHQRRSSTGPFIFVGEIDHRILVIDFTMFNKFCPNEDFSFLMCRRPNRAFLFALCALATSLPSRSEPSMLGFVTEPMKKVS